MSHWKSQLNNYHGSKLLLPIAVKLGIQVDKLNFLAAGFVAVGMAYIYSYLIHVQRMSVKARKILVIIFGVIILSFCFGRDIVYVVIEATVSYVLMRVVSLQSLPQITLVVCLIYQSALHLLRQYSDPGGYTIDITGAIMMLTQRVSILAFSLRDAVHTDGLTGEQIRDAIPEMPDVLSYFAYMLDFHMLLAGPLIPYKTFMRITEGKNLRPDGSTAVTHWRVVCKLFCVGLNILLILFVVPLIKENDILSEWFSSLPFYRKILCIVAFSFLCRLQYYVAWKLAEASCDASAYGYYITKNGEERWDGADNINITQVETATSMKNLIDNWNVSTQRWLKHVCYDRQLKYKTIRTFFLSALWHGLYPGYFLSFMTAMFFVVAAREVRNYLRPRLLSGRLLSKPVYDVVTYIVTAVFLSYSIMPFILLQLDKAFYIWRELHFFGHLIAPWAFALRLFLPRVPLTTPAASQVLLGPYLGLKTENKISWFVAHLCEYVYLCLYNCLLYAKHQSAIFSKN